MPPASMPRHSEARLQPRVCRAWGILGIDPPITIEGNFNHYPSVNGLTRLSIRYRRRTCGFLATTEKVVIRPLQQRLLGASATARGVKQMKKATCLLAASMFAATAGSAFATGWEPVLIGTTTQQLFQAD